MLTGDCGVAGVGTGADVAAMVAVVAAARLAVAAAETSEACVCS